MCVSGTSLRQVGIHLIICVVVSVVCGLSTSKRFKRVSVRYLGLAQYFKGTSLLAAHNNLFKAEATKKHEDEDKKLQ